VVNEAEVQRLPDRLSLADLLERYPRRHGAAAVRAVLADLAPGGTVTRSELEMRFREFVKVRRLPAPVFNAGLFAGGRWLECDCVWHAERLVVELDGRGAHDTATAFERDRARDRGLQAGGWHVVRLTWRQLRDEPEAVASDLRRMLSGMTQG
jgi:very-short-patch-repair endonuclease